MSKNSAGGKILFLRTSRFALIPPLVTLAVPPLSSAGGRMFICFVGLILASYVRHIWEGNEYLRKNFDSIESILAEMRTIRCIEHTGRMKFVTPFVGAQVKICEAFDFPIPDCCAPVYVSKAKQTTRRRGRPAKPKVEKQTF